MTHYRTPEQKAAHAAAEREANRAGKRKHSVRTLKPCSVCGGPKIQAKRVKGVRTCDDCWGKQPPKDLEALIREQAKDDSHHQDPQRFGPEYVGSFDHDDEHSHWRLRGSAWDDPVANEVLSLLDG